MSYNKICMYKLELDPNNNEAQASSTPTYTSATPLRTPAIDERANIRQNQDSMMSQKSKRNFIIICVVAVLAGTLTGFGSYKLKNKQGASQMTEQVAVTDPNSIKNGDVFGVQDKDAFVDSATGYIEAGGVEGEGSHKLLREGGPSQTVALTSSVVDLEKLVGSQVKIYGETFKAEKAGWFMDVGRVEVIEVNAQAPLQTLD